MKFCFWVPYLVIDADYYRHDTYFRYSKSGFLYEWDYMKSQWYSQSHYRMPISKSDLEFLNYKDLRK